jgi:NADP-dependent 3-hydroxy acid dehydrogenase YdfG
MMAGLFRPQGARECAFEQLDALVDENRQAMLDLMQAVLEDLADRKDDPGRSVRVV